MSGKTTSADVASAAGVSRATVSYVLNNRLDKHISETTRQAVLEAARKLNYSPSSAARALRRGQGDVVVALVPNRWDTSEPIARLLSDVGTELAAHGLAFMRYQVNAQPGSIKNVVNAVTAACVVTFQPLSDPDQAILDVAGVGEVRAWVLQSSVAAKVTRIGQRDIVRTQIEHLIAIGCERLVYVAENSARGDDFVRARTDAFTSLAAGFGLEGAATAYLAPASVVANETIRPWITRNSRVGLCAFSDVVA